MFKASVFFPESNRVYFNFAVDSTGTILYGFGLRQIKIMRYPDFTVTDTVLTDLYLRCSILSGDDKTIFVMGSLGNKIMGFDIASKSFRTVATVEELWHFREIHPFGSNDLLTLTPDGLFWIDGKTGATKLKFDDSYEICFGAEPSRVIRRRGLIFEDAEVNAVFVSRCGLLLCATSSGMFVFDCQSGKLVFKTVEFGKCWSFGYIGLNRFLVGFESSVKIWNKNTQSFSPVLVDMRLMKKKSLILVYLDKSHAIIVLDSKIFVLYDTKTEKTINLDIPSRDDLDRIVMEPNSGDVLIFYKNMKLKILKMQPEIAFAVYKGLVEFQGTKYKNTEVMSNGRIIGSDGRLIGIIDKN